MSLVIHIPHGKWAVKLGAIPAGTFTLPEQNAAMEKRVTDILDLVTEIAADAGSVSVHITPVVPEN